MGATLRSIMKTRTTKLSVVMSVFNGADYVREAINSILSQTYQDFEFIVIDDGSDDGTADILKSYDDPRMVILSQANQGLVASLNLGIKQAKGAFIARQDADDRSEPDRLQKQMAYLSHHKQVVLLGSGMSVMNENGKITHTHSVLLRDPELRQELLVRSPFAHGSVIFKKSAAKKAGAYKKSEWPAEDYGLWLRMSKYGRLANLDEYLYVYRENSAGISSRNQSLQAEAVSKVQSLAWQERKRLIKGGVRLSSYKKRSDGPTRIERILHNIETAARAAKQNKDVLSYIKLINMLSLSPTAYRRLAGKMKRSGK